MSAITARCWECYVPVAMTTLPTRMVEGCMEPQEPTRMVRFTPSLMSSVKIMSTLYALVPARVIRVSIPRFVY